MTVEAGDAAPPFDLISDDGTKVSLGDFAGSRLLMYFYPKAFTPGCTTQACDFRDRYQTFEKAGFAIVGISPDKPEKLAKFRAEYGLPFAMLSDPDHSVAEAYGAWGIKKNYGKEYEGLIRSTFVISPEGVVTEAWRNVRAKGHAERISSSLPD